MNRLLWKEHRESWAYGLALCISSVLTVLLGTAYTFVSHINLVTSWVLLPVTISMMYGAFSLSHEKERKILGYATCDSISHDRLILAKATLALIYSIVAVIASLVVFLLSSMLHHIPTSIPEISYGVCMAVTFTSLAWYFGFGLSIFTHFETNLHMLLWAVLVTLFIPLAATYEVAYSWWALWPTWILLITPLLVLILHRHCKWRSDSKSFKVGIWAIIIMTVTLAICAGRYQVYTHIERKLMSVSPDGHIALFLVTKQQSKRSATQMYWQFIDASNGSMLYRCDNAYVTNSRFRTKTWISANTAIIEYLEPPHKLSVNIITFHDRYHPISQTLPCDPLGSGTRDIRPSVNGDYIILTSIGGVGSPPMRVLDVWHGKWLTEPIRVRNYWWQSDHSAGYIDAAGKRHILPLPGGNGQ